jgi:hypothetical protein
MLLQAGLRASRYIDSDMYHVKIRSRCPLLLAAERATNGKTERPIKWYEIAWEREPSLAATAEEAWSRRVPSQDLGDANMALREVMGSLFSWKTKYF